MNNNSVYKLKEYQSESGKRRDGLKPAVVNEILNIFEN